MKRLGALLFSILLAAGAVAVRAQVFPSATGREVSITAGGTASIFQPDFAVTGYVYALWASLSVTILSRGRNYPLFGAGAYVDLRLRRWVQIEAEGRWQRWNSTGRKLSGITRTTI